MIQLGDWNELTITRFTDHGAYLDGGDLGEILLPKAYVERTMHPGDTVRVFVYLDQSERLVGTREHPLARVGEFAYLRVAWTNEYGAFLDWGLMKDLFVPFREQKTKMRRGASYVVYIYVDAASRRIVATSKVERYLTPAAADSYTRGQEVEVLVQSTTPLGFKVIVDGAHPGLIYANQVFGEQPRLGDSLRGTVVSLRPDGKLDISLERLGTQRFRDFADTLLDELRAADGFLPFTDASSPEAIAERFSVSKKTFKRALGTLYKAQKIMLHPDGIRILE
jgi:hypothetical protein